MRILKDHSVGLVIDIQERLFPHIFECDHLEKNVNILVDGLKVLGVPVLVTEQYKKGLGNTLPSLQAKLEGCASAEKMAFSCCDEPMFVEQLELLTRRVVLIAGIESHICVLQTAIDLKERGFEPVIIADCVGSRTRTNKELALERYKQEGILISSCESILFELCRFAGTEEFKAISRLVK